MKSGVDNAAHVGGLVGGLVFGYVYYLGQNLALPFNGDYSGAGLTLLTILGAGYYIYANRVGADQRKASRTRLEQPDTGLGPVLRTQRPDH